MPTIRTLGHHDLKQVLEIWRCLGSDYGYPIGGSWNEKSIELELQSGSSIGIFDDQKQLIAFCLLALLPGAKEIRLLATRPREHRTGAMRALVRSVIEDLAAGEMIWLEVHAGNLPAIGLYESLGFKFQNERQGYYSDGGTALLYEYKPLQ